MMSTAIITFFLAALVTSQSPSVDLPSIDIPSTQSSSTQSSSTQSPSTQSPSTQPPSTQSSSTLSPSTFFPSTQPPSTTVALLLPIETSGGGIRGLMGSIAGVDASATTYIIGCVPPPINGTAAAATSMGLNSSDIAELEPGYDPCDFDNVSQTITQGPSTYHWAVSHTRADDALAFDCTLTGSTQAACLMTASASASPNAAHGNATNEYNLHSTEIFSASNLPYQQVVLTAGLSYLKPSNASSTGSTVSSKSGHTGGTSKGTASGSKSTSKSSSGAAVMEPALGLGVAGMMAIGLAALAL